MLANPAVWLLNKVEETRQRHMCNLSTATPLPCHETVMDSSEEALIFGNRWTVHIPADRSYLPAGMPNRPYLKSARFGLPDYTETPHRRGCSC